MKKSLILLLMCIVFTMGCRSPDDDEEIENPPELSETNLKKLTTSGTKIVEMDTGNEVTLRGITFTGGVWNYPGTSDISQIEYMTTEWDFTNVKSWGVNVISFYMDYYWFETGDGYIFLEKILNWCRENDIYLIPNINVTPGGMNRGGPPFFESETNKSLLIDFWKDFAARYKDREEIAGYCLIDEPHSEGSDMTWEEMREMVKDYMERVIGEVRTIDSDTPIFIEPVYGGVGHYYEIDPKYEHIVHNIHFYEPMGYTASGYPWIGSGGVPVDVNYPGEYVYSVSQTQLIHYSAVSGGTTDWIMYELEGTVPDNGTNMVYITIYCSGDPGATYYFDHFQYELDGAGFTDLPYGSFEEGLYISDDIQPSIWNKDEENGTIERDTNVVYDGSYSLKFTNCTGWTQAENIDYWVASAGGVEVSAGQNFKVRFWVKSVNAADNKAGIQIKWAKVYKDYLDKTSLQGFVDGFLLDRRSSTNRPFFIGEFTPSLANVNRDESLHFLRDLIEYFNANNLYWSYYVYREHWSEAGKIFLGIYNGAPNVTTDNCPIVANDIINLIKQYY